jgi:hypothetical protein
VKVLQNVFAALSQVIAAAGDILQKHRDATMFAA